jgi:sugar lactone lactonase YvrE
MKGTFKMPEVQTLLTGLAIGESPRWHHDRLWFSNWGTQEVVTVNLDGKSEVIVRVPTHDSLLHRLVARWTPARRLGA